MATNFATFYPCQMGVLEVKLKVSTPVLGGQETTGVMRPPSFTYIKTVACTDGYHGGICHEIRHFVDADFLRASGYDMDRVEAAVPEVTCLRGKGMQRSECLGMCGPLYLQYRLFENAPASAWWAGAARSVSPPSASSSSSSSSSMERAAPADGPAAEPLSAAPPPPRISTIVDITLANVLVVESLPVPLLISLRGLGTPGPGASSSGSGGTVTSDNATGRSTTSISTNGTSGSSSGSGSIPVPKAARSATAAGSPSVAPFPAAEAAASPGATPEELERDKLLCRILSAQLNSHSSLRRELVPESYWVRPALVYALRRLPLLLRLQYVVYFSIPPALPTAVIHTPQPVSPYPITPRPSQDHLFWRGDTPIYTTLPSLGTELAERRAYLLQEKGRLAEAEAETRGNDSQLDSVSVRTCQICARSADLQKCGRCWRVVYCGVAHQRQDWGRHKRTCCPAPLPS